MYLVPTRDSLSMSDSYTRNVQSTHEWSEYQRELDDSGLVFHWLDGKCRNAANPDESERWRDVTTCALDSEFWDDVERILNSLPGLQWHPSKLHWNWAPGSVSQLRCFQALLERGALRPDTVLLRYEGEREASLLDLWLRSTSVCSLVRRADTSIRNAILRDPFNLLLPDWTRTDAPESAAFIASAQKDAWTTHVSPFLSHFLPRDLVGVVRFLCLAAR